MSWGWRRAQRTASGADATLAGTVTGAREKTLVGSAVYDADTVDTGLVSDLTGQANSWLADASGPAGWDIGAGIIVRSDGDLEIVDDIDLSPVNGSGWLGLEAADDLVIQANISDGFDSSGRAGALESGASFSFGLQAGRDIVIGEFAPPPAPVVIGGGQQFDKARPFAPALPVTVAASWKPPAGMIVYDANGNSYLRTRPVPAGTTIVRSNTRNFLASYVLPADAFPNGLIYPAEPVPFTGEGRIIRTGTGDIAVRAGRDLMLGEESTVYTAGRRTATAAGFDPGSTEGKPLGEFPTMGGNIAVEVGRDITGALTKQANSAWLFRYGHTDWGGTVQASTVAQQTSWSIMFKNFEQGIGALGGGNIAIRVGGDVTNLSTALPTTGHLSTAVGQRARAADLHVRGGGDLALDVGGDLLGGMFMLGRGRGDIAVAGNVGASADMVPLRQYLSSTTTTVVTDVAPLFGLMDASLRIVSGGGMEIEGAYDPMMQGQICENLGGCAGAVTGSAFSGYTERAAIDATALGGALIYRNNPVASVDLTLGNGDHQVQMDVTSSSDPRPQLINYLTWAPGTVKFASLTSSVALLAGAGEQRMKIAPTDNGTVELLAQDDVRINMSYAIGDGLTMLDVGQVYRRDALNPFSTTASGRFTYGNTGHITSAANNYDRGFELSHANDPEPARIYALNGSICNAALTAACLPNASYYFQVGTSKPLDLYAGELVTGGTITIQHNDAAALSRIVSGGDIDQVSVMVTGEGALVMEAERDILSRTSSIAAGGDTAHQFVGGQNLALAPDRAASITLLAGAAGTRDYDGFGAVYLDPANAAGAVRTYLPELHAYMKELGYSEMSDAEAVETFGTLAQQSREAFLRTVLFTELKETGIDYNKPESPRSRQYTRGYDAVKRLFTESSEATSHYGDVILNSRQVETHAEGDITILAPYGRVEIGSPVTPANFNPNNGGVITRRGGNVRIFADDDIALYTSRVFTMQGGDIAMWTSNGDISAGFGAKTSVTQVPLRYTMSNDATLAIDVFGLQTGAGIGVLDALQGRDENRRKSRLDLLAFRGEVNAGDAGIRVIGDINIAALRVVNAANIEVSGDAVGIPEVPVVNVGALTAASTATSAIVNEAARLADRTRPQPVRDIPAIVNVRFVGFGE